MARRKNKLIFQEDIEAENIVEVTDFDIALTLFLRDCKIRNLSEYTLNYYSNELTKFRKMLEEQGKPTNPSQIKSNAIKECVILKMMEEGRKDATINARLRAIRSFFNFLHREGYLFTNPMSGIKLIRQKIQVVETFSRQQVHDLLRQPDQTTFTGLRDYTMLLVLFETGVRVKELANVKIDDINFEDNTLRIRDPKGLKERLVPFQTTVKKYLRKYLQVRGNLEHDYVFVTLDNTPISVRAFQNNMAKYGRQANIKNVRCSPHTIRHTFAKMAVLNGADIFTLQKILGHSSLEMVRRYVELFSKDIQKNHQKFSPVENLF